MLYLNTFIQTQRDNILIRKLKRDRSIWDYTFDLFILDVIAYCILTGWFSVLDLGGNCFLKKTGKKNS